MSADSIPCRDERCVLCDGLHPAEEGREAFAPDTLTALDERAAALEWLAVAEDALRAAAWTQSLLGLLPLEQRGRYGEAVASLSVAADQLGALIADDPAFVRPSVTDADIPF